MEQNHAGPKVLLIDDDDEVRNLVRARLEASNCVVVEAASGEEGLRRFDAQIDVVLVDLGLPGIDGFTVVRSIRFGSNVPIMIVSAGAEEGDRVLGFEIGADDYVVKPILPRELVARVHALLRRSTAAPSTPARLVTFGQIEVDGNARQARRAGQHLALTQREFDLLWFLVSSPRQALSREQLLRQVWQAEPGWLDPGTVTEHIHRLRRAVEADPANPTHIVTVRGVGYRFDP